MAADEGLAFPLPGDQPQVAPEVILNNTIDKLKSVLETQGINAQIPSFSGESGHFNDWIKCIEKYAILARIEPKTMKLVAFQSSRGAVSDYIKRRITSATHADEDWLSLKANLAAKFGEVFDSHVAFTLLRQAKQKPGESCVVFSERLINLADSSFTGQTINSEHVERQLIGIFIDGLLDDRLKWKLMNSKPRTLADCIDTAVAEESMRKLFDLRTGRTQPMKEDRYPLKEYAPRTLHRNRPAPLQEEPGEMTQRQTQPRIDTRQEEPMEINLLRPTRPCRLCRVVHPRNQPCPNTRVVNEVQHQPTRNSSAKKLAANNSQDWQEKATCFGCGKVGHIRSSCPYKPPPTCYNCGGPHVIRNCPLRDVKLNAGN